MSTGILDQTTTLLPGNASLAARSVHGRAKDWFRNWLLKRRRTRIVNKPDWVHVPDRVWRRQSALIMCLHELRNDRDDHG